MIFLSFQHFLSHFSKCDDPSIFLLKERTSESQLKKYKEQSVSRKKTNFLFPNPPHPPPPPKPARKNYHQRKKKKKKND